MATAPISIARAKAIPGYMADVELRWLAKSAAEARTIVEVGSYKGRSTRVLADHCQGVVYAVDPWDGGYKNDDGSQAKWLNTAAALQDFHANMRDHIGTGRVVPCVGTLEEAIAAGLGLTFKADMVFIDGDHRYREVLRDIANAKRILKPGGLLCGHDWGHVKWPGVARAVRECFADGFGLCHSIWWAR